MKYYTFYHNDMDGKSAAWNVHQWLLKQQVEDNPVNYQRHGYSDEWKLSKLDKDTTAFVVDLSFTNDTYQQLLDICDKAGQVIWIDHHKSSKELLVAHPEIQKIKNLAMLVSMDACGALLTYVFLLYMDRNPKMFGLGNIMNVEFDYVKNTAMINNVYKVFIPNWLNLVDDYDRWQKRSPNTDRFILGMDAENTAISYKTKDGRVVFNDDFWSRCTNITKVNEFINKGTIIQEYLNAKYRRELPNCFEYTLSDGTILLCRNGNGNSWVFQDEILNYPAVVLFNYDGRNNNWRHSVYSDENSSFDCAKFCEQYGGGGHMHAAGFTINKPIFVPEN